MNKKEISELRRRFSPDKNAIGHIYGCYVNTKKEIIAYLDESLTTMPPEEAEKYLGFLKKALSGTQGKNLIDIVFSTQQVVDSPEHKLLMSLRETELKDPAERQAFYDKVIESLDMDGSNYLVLLAHDAYDVPFKAKDGLTFDQVSDTMFHYVVCCVCPVKEGKAALGFYAAQNEFHSYGTNQVVGQPELGFLFPAEDAALPPGAPEAAAVAEQLHEGGGDGVETDARAAVAQAGVDAHQQGVQSQWRQRPRTEGRRQHQHCRSRREQSRQQVDHLQRLRVFLVENRHE